MQNPLTRVLLPLALSAVVFIPTARAVITRRDQLIRLGIGKRRSKKVAPLTAPTVPAAPVTTATQPQAPLAIATTTIADDEPGPQSTGPSAPLRRAA